MTSKRIFTHTLPALLLALCLLLSLAACGKDEDDTAAHVEGTLEELMTQLYANVTDIESPHTMELELTAENAAYYLGSDEVPYTEALGSDAAISSIPHSVVLLRLEEGADAEAAKTLIKENVNPRKWICVGVEEDEVIVDNIGDLVFLVMSPNAQAYHQAFLQLGQAEQ